MIYRDRRTAGRELARLLAEYAHRPDVMVLALPRGGLPVAAEIADELRVPLDVLVVRKLGLPWQPELAAGAIAPGGIVVRNPEVAAYFENLDQTIAEVATREKREMRRREALYRAGRAPLEVRNRIVILVDDGIATGSTMEAAVLAMRAMQARSVIIAVPVAPPELLDELRRHADQVICPNSPQPFIAVGRWYEHFPQLTDEEVVDILTHARAGTPRAEARAASQAGRGQ